MRKGSRRYPWGDSLNGREANVNGYYPHGTSTKGPYLQKTVQIGSYEPNAWGLHDTVGNVFEWCSDWYDEDYYASSPERDPRGPSSGSSRVLRGGSWHANAIYGKRKVTRSANRHFYPPVNRFDFSGFRVVAE